MTMLSVALAYRELWRVEAIFRTAKSILETRPIFHQSDAAIAGHLFCSFLALLLRKELDERLTAAGVNAAWDDIVRDLDRVEQVIIEQGPKRFVLRPQAPGCAGAVFKAVGVALPPLIRQIPTGPPPQARCRPLHHAAVARSVVPRRPEFPGFVFYSKLLVKVTVQLERDHPPRTAPAQAVMEEGAQAARSRRAG